MLLTKVLRYEAQDRLPLADVIDVPWFTVVTFEFNGKDGC